MNSEKRIVGLTKGTSIRTLKMPRRASRRRRFGSDMTRESEDYASKVPEVTLGFWIIKIAATTLGETGGDTVSMTMNSGYLIGTATGRRLRSPKH